jgi:hypothetical protein
MRLDLNALWIDDVPNSIRSLSDRIALGMRKEGFLFRPTIVPSLAEARPHLADGVFADNIDLVLIDFTLGGGPHGNVALREVRSQLPFREIVFYSANAAFDLKKQAFDEDVQGIYCAHRDELVDTVIGVFETLIKKVLDVDHARGIVMGATSDIDHLINDVLLGMHVKLDDTAKAALHEGISKRIDKKVAQLTERASAAKAAAELSEAFEAYDIITSFDKLRMLVDLLKDGKHDEEARKKVTIYMEKVVPDRTLLAHVAVTVDESGKRVLRGRKGKELTEQRLRELRSELLEHRENFHALAALLGIKV